MREVAILRLDGQVLDGVRWCLQGGAIAVLLGAGGTGKSSLAAKALPSARVVSGRETGYRAAGVMDSDLVGDELAPGVPPDEFIRSRNQALALGHRVIVTGQVLADVRPYLAGLRSDQYQVFDLNWVWERR